MSLERAVDLVRRRGRPVQLVVGYRGEAVVDLAVGCDPDARFWLFSAGKAHTGLVVHALAELRTAGERQGHDHLASRAPTPLRTDHGRHDAR